MKCSYCSEPSAHSMVRTVGAAPANPLHNGGQRDERKLENVYFCPAHWARLTTFLDLTLRLS